MTSMPNKKRKTAAKTFVRELYRDQEYVSRLVESEKQRQQRIQEIKKVTAPVVQDLRDAGYQVGSIQELLQLYKQNKAGYPAAVPILITWLPRLSNIDAKELIIQTLCVPWAREAAPALIREFRSAAETPVNETTWKWDIGNALSVVADDRTFNDIADLVLDKRHGRDREMLALALANMKDERAVDVLIKLLDDDDVAGHAILALRKVRARRAAPHIERFLSHPKSWIRAEAKKALKRLT